MSVEPLFGPLPDGWGVATLGDACARGGGNIQTGPFGSQLLASNYVPVGFPTIMPQNIGDNRIVTEGIARIAPEDAERLSRYRVRVGDIVYSRRGDVEKRALVRAGEDGWLCGTGSLRVRFGDGPIDSTYASYYLGHPEVRGWIVRHAIGAAMPNLNTPILSALPLVIPPLPEQRAIAAILGALDDKIELNRRMNRTLEAMAQALFQSWFVDFDPVRAKLEGRQSVGMDAETAALFPAAFEDSALGEIPQGWKVGTLGEVATNPGRTVEPRSVRPDTPYIGLEHMPRQSIALTEWGQAGEITSGKARFVRGEILFGKLRPYFHKVGVAPVDGVCSTDILTITPKFSRWFGFVLEHLSSTELVNHANACPTGTKMPRVSWSDLARYETVIPGEEVTDRFTVYVFPIVEQIAAKIMQSRTLASIRDTLLPKLLSGEIRVPEAERVVEAAL